MKKIYFPRFFHRFCHGDGGHIDLFYVLPAYGQCKSEHNFLPDALIGDKLPRSEFFQISLTEKTTSPPFYCRLHHQNIESVHMMIPRVNIPKRQLHERAVKKIHFPLPL